MDCFELTQSFVCRRTPFLRRAQCLKIIGLSITQEKREGERRMSLFCSAFHTVVVVGGLTLHSKAITSFLGSAFIQWVSRGYKWCHDRRETEVRDSDTTTQREHNTRSTDTNVTNCSENYINIHCPLLNTPQERELFAVVMRQCCEMGNWIWSVGRTLTLY